ncbi:class I SAM-dependent methyltransferase [Enterobacter bugandensis]|uniref:class I SAM-dependent methyltransferase n=1 Tax=Enterobacter bugandensis TaxID=881260 RepID=UPI001953E2C8|nr:class I SAM-dependent methyltransferase [Enterobacter bugandensis]
MTNTNAAGENCIAYNNIIKLLQTQIPKMRSLMKSFDELLKEAMEADVQGWGFDWLDGKATEERPSWGYAGLIRDRLSQVKSALDLDTGGGEVLNEAPEFPAYMAATEAWPPNLKKARELLLPRGVNIIDTSITKTLPFNDQSFELVTSRHPVAPDWPEIYRVLKPGGSYLAQHVGPASAFELIEYFLGPLPKERMHRDPGKEKEDAEKAGLKVIDLRTARCRMEFFDISAVVWILRKCVWWVPDFSVDKYYRKLQAMDQKMRLGHPFVAYSSRHLIEAQR